MTGTVGNYKVAYTLPGKYQNVYSKMAENIGEARQYADTLKGEGARVVIMENLGMEQSATGNYKWKILDDYSGKTAKTGMVLTDGRFIIFAVMVIVAALWLGSSKTSLDVAWS